MIKKHLLGLLPVLIIAPAIVFAADSTSRLPKTYAKPLANDPMKVTIHRLDNGLTIYLSENHETPRITANIATRAGSRHDPRNATGIAHYLEHMLFKGSQNLGTSDWKAEKIHLEKIRALYEKLFTMKDEADRKKIFEAIDDANKEAAKHAIPNEFDRLYKTLGFGGINAYTSNERTVYISDFPKNRAETWATVEADRFAAPVFRLFQSELETVYEEKNRAMDDPGRIFGRAYMEAMYPEHPYSTPTLGTVEHLKNPSLEKMYAFFSRFYRPNNMAIALAGDFDSKEMLAIVKKHFAAWEPQEIEALPEFPLPGPRGIKSVNVECEAEEMLMIGWHTVKRDHPDRNALTLMDMLVDNSSAGILNLYLNQQQKVKSSGASPSFNNDAGSWRMWGTPKDGQTLKQVEDLLMEVVAKLKKGEFEQDDIDAIITDFEVSRKRGLESNSARVGAMITAYAAYEEWETTAAWLENMGKVTKADVLRVANKYLTDNRIVATRTKGKPEIPSIAKPNFTKIPIETDRQSAFFQKVASIQVNDIEPKWIADGEDYVVSEGDWGKLVAVKNPIHDLFSLSFTFDRGRRHEKTLPYASKLWRLSGAGDMSAEQFKKRLYSLGSTMGFWCGEQNSGASITGLEKNFDETLKLLKLRFAAPNIQTDDLKKMIEVELGRRKDSKVNPGSQQNALRQWAQRGDESSVLQDIPNEELQKLDAEKLKALMATVFDYKAEISYSGLRSGDALLDSFVEKGKRYKKGYKRRPLRYVRARKNRVLFLNRDMAQSKVGMFSPDKTWDPDNWVDYMYFSDYVGGGMSAVLFQEVRESRALAYVVGGGYRYGRRMKDQNMLVGGVGTQSDKTLEATTLVRDLLAKLPLDKTRFENTKESIEQAFRTHPLTYSQIPRAVHSWTHAGIRGGDPRADRMEAALKYTLEDLERFSKQFSDRNWIIYILGSQERVDPKTLSSLGEVEIIEMDSLYPY